MGSLQGVLGRALYQFLLLYACEEGTQSWMLLELGGHFFFFKVAAAVVAAAGIFRYFKRVTLASNK